MTFDPFSLSLLVLFLRQCYCYGDSLFTVTSSTVLRSWPLIYFHFHFYRYSYESVNPTAILFLRGSYFDFDFYRYSYGNPIPTEIPYLPLFYLEYRYTAFTFDLFFKSTGKPNQVSFTFTFTFSVVPTAIYFLAYFFYYLLVKRLKKPVCPQGTSRS